MKIRTRLNISAGVSLGMILVMAVSVVWSVIQSRESSENLILAGEIRNVILERTILRDEYFIHREDRARIQWETKSSSLDALLKAFSGRLSEDSERAIIDEVFESYKDTLAIFRKIVENEARTKSGGNEIERAITKEYENRLFSQLLLKAYELNNGAARLFESLNQTAISVQRRITLILAACVILLFLTLFINGALLNRIIRVRLARLRKGSEIIGGGDLDHRVDDLADDEISDLARATNEMAVKLKRSNTSVENLQTEIAERKRAEETLAASEARYRRFFEATRDGVLILDAETGMVVDVNPFLIELLGYSHEVFLGKKIWELGFFRDIVANQDNFLELQQKEYIRYEDMALETSDGGRIEVEFTSHVYLVHNQKVIQCNIRDISDRKRAEAALQQSSQELQEKNVELERFLYTVSHGLKSPVVTVRAFLGYLEQDMADGKAERIEKDMLYIRAAADKMAQLLDELLEFSRISRVITPPVRVTLRLLVDEALAAVAGNITERGVQTKVTDHDVPLYGDRVRLAEIWQNLIENAVKFMGDQPEPCIEIGVETRRAEQCGAEHVFFVRDNGIGIDPRFQAKIFGLFEKLDAKAEGTGIGLAIVQRIVGLSGGRIWVESEGLGQGGCFYFTLPEAEERSQKSGDRSQNENTGDQI